MTQLFTSGMDILRQIRADERFKTTPILVTTADILRGNALAEPGVEVLIKPVSVTRLSAIATRILSDSQAARQANQAIHHEEGIE